MIALPRSVADRDEAIRLAPAIGFMEYGQGSYLSRIDDHGDEITMFLGMKFPILIEDEDRSIPVIRKIPNVTSVRFLRNSSGRFGYEYEDYSRFQENLIKNDYAVLQTLERELIRNTYESLARIPSVANTMTPLMEISNSFRFQEKLGLDRIIKSRKNEKQMNNYVKFMVRNGLVDIKEKDVYPTKKLLRYLDSKDSNVSVPIMGDLLMRGYSDLMNFLHLSGLKPYLTIANSYYTPSSEAGSLLRVRIQRLQEYYRKLYRMSPVILKLQNQVSMLSEVKIFNIKDRLITGTDQILEKQIKIRESFVA